MTKMPLLNRPMTAIEIKMVISDKFFVYSNNKLFELINEPKYQYVKYRAKLNRIDYERPNTFYELGPKSPSDCHWMVPTCKF